jgi:hypothetical protein
MLASASVASAAGAHSPTGALIPAHKGQVLPKHGGTTSSLNWSGYAVTPGSGITAVSSSFTVPSAGLVPPGFAATWTGIGGYNEWILEAPTIVAQTILAPAGTVDFGPTSTYTDGGGTHTIAAGNPTQIDLGSGVVNEATPSALAADGQSFNDCAYAQSCAAP